MGNDVLAGMCTNDVGVASFVCALWQLGGGALALFFVFCTVERFAPSQTMTTIRLRH